MRRFIARRLGVLSLILFGSTFLVYNLAAFSSDPLAELRLSTDPNKDQMIINVTRQLQLDVPPPIRYFLWLKGVLGVFIGQFNLGQTRDLASVQSELLSAIPTSFRLVVVSTFTALIIGMALGITTALRQYSKFDYSMTFVAFLLFSLPIFWVAVLLKEFLAIQFNNFLSNPHITIKWLIILSIISGIFWASILGGERKKYITNLGYASIITAIVLIYINFTNWLLEPGFGPLLVLVFAIGIAYGVTHISTGISNKAALRSSQVMAVIGLVLYYPLQWILDKSGSYLVIIGLAFSTIAIAFGVSSLFSKIDRGPITRTAAITGLLVGVLILADRLMQAWKPYMAFDAINGRPVPTVGQRNDQLVTTDFWINNLDIVMHIFLPTIALTLISIASWIRYSRGAMLEVLNQDYIRTARAKGLPERTVIVRHAFRNTMLPLSSLFVGEVAGLIGGAIITERVFGWYGMGTLFNRAVTTFDLNLLMGVLLVFSTIGVLANLAADLLYSALDPRIRMAE